MSGEFITDGKFYLVGLQWTLKFGQPESMAAWTLLIRHFATGVILANEI
jgi:hypothetical protein